MKTYSSIEPLESRIAPALILKFGAGLLNISGDADTNTVLIGQSAGMIEVFDGATSLGTFTGVKSIVAKLRGPTDVDLDLGGGIAGSLSVNIAGAGSLSLGAGSKIGGALTFTGDNEVQALSIGANVSVGKALVFNGALGIDTFTLNAGSSIGGNAVFSSVETGTFNTATAIDITGNLVFKNAAGTGPVNITTSEAPGLNVTGAISYTGCGGDDKVSLIGTFGRSAKFSDSKGGNNTFYFTEAVIHGAVNVTTGNGNDIFGMQLATVDKNVTMDLGSGNNEFQYGFAGGVNVGGNVRLTTGAGDDAWRGLGGTLTVSKNVFVQLGDGTNKVNVGVVVNGSKMVVATGSGVDTIGLYGTATNAALQVRSARERMISSTL